MKENFVLMCGGRRCCPQVKIDDDTVVITDDYDGKVQMTTDQLVQLVDKVKELFPHE